MTVAVRTHTFVRFANRFLRCGRCGQPVGGWHDDQVCGTPHEPCPVDWYLSPCGHKAIAKSTCPSWSPVGGCTCSEPCA